jgi:hypothetical protein
MHFQIKLVALITSKNTHILLCPLICMIYMTSSLKMEQYSQLASMHSLSAPINHSLIAGLYAFLLPSAVFSDISLDTFFFHPF